MNAPLCYMEILFFALLVFESEALYTSIVTPTTEYSQLAVINSVDGLQSYGWKSS